jgi:hypothetical protein
MDNNNLKKDGLFFKKEHAKSNNNYKDHSKFIRDLGSKISPSVKNDNNNIFPS